MIKNRIIPFVTLLFLGVFACKEGPAKAAETPGMTNLTDFNAFYMRFHRDTAYQTAHITFPLDGLPANADSLTMGNEQFKWQRNDWKYHQLLDDDEFTRNFLVLNDNLVSESIRLKNSNLGLVRRFAKMGDDWYLIYYAGLNQIKGAEQ
ncbi:MAG: hypothetical protein KDC24_06270 [Saprospiraceae bacterium]|nr:hypothetical protein [Saprospiraceae bacterium]